MDDTLGKRIKGIWGRGSKDGGLVEYQGIVATQRMRASYQ